MPTIIAAGLADIAAVRDEFRAESACQVVHDSLYERRGWCEQYLLQEDGVTVGFAGLAVAGPWKGHRTLFDFYVARPQRAHWAALWQAFQAVAQFDSYELQTNLPLGEELLQRLGGTPRIDRFVYGEGRETSLAVPGARLRRLTPEQEIRECIRDRAGAGEWALELDGFEVGQGALLFHYNVPYADISMEIHEPFRRRGFGAYLVQELKRAARELGAIPAARTNSDNLASQCTLEKAGLKLVGRIMAGEI